MCKWLARVAFAIERRDDTARCCPDKVDTVDAEALVFSSIRAYHDYRQHAPSSPRVDSYTARRNWGLIS